MLAATVAGVLMVVGLPTLALTLASHSTGGDRASAATAAPSATANEQDEKADGDAGEKHADKVARKLARMHGRGHGHLRQRLGGPPFAHGLRPGHRLKDLTPQQRTKVADRLERRADRLDALAACLRSKAEVSTCRKAATPHHAKR